MFQASKRAQQGTNEIMYRRKKTGTRSKKSKRTKNKIDLVRYNTVPPDLYLRVKKGLQNDHVLSQYPSFHESMYDSFEIISLEGKVAVYYYKDGTLAVEGNESNSFFRRIVRQVNKIISKKEYL